MLRAATWGRGVFELAAPTGPAIFVAQSELAFGETCALTGASLPIDVTNVGAQDLVINSVQRIGGPPDFTVLPTPSTPLTITPNGHDAFTVHFVPTSAAAVSAVIRVSDSDPGAPSVDLVAVGKLETQPPSISCPAPITIECTTPSGATVSFSAAATDNCAVASVACPASGSTFPLGTTLIWCTATDTAGNKSGCSSSVKVVDTKPPVIGVVTATPNLLWPPNHKMVGVTVSYNATDNCSAEPTCEITSVTSNEQISNSDYAIVDPHHVNLVADRLGSSSNGRIYTITVKCTDASDNSSNQAVMVTVPHDQGKK